MYLKDSGKNMDNSSKSKGQVAIWVSIFSGITASLLSQGEGTHVYRSMFASWTVDQISCPLLVVHKLNAAAYITKNTNKTSLN